MFENENNKEKHLRKILNKFVKKDQNQFLKDSLFFDFFNLENKIKDKTFKHKNSSKTCCKTLVRWEEKLSKNLVENSPQNPFI